MIDIDTKVESFEESDHEGIVHVFQNVTAEITIDTKVEWSESVVTDDTIESVCDAREALYWDAAQHAVKQYGYELDDEDYRLAGFMATPA